MLAGRDDIPLLVRGAAAFYEGDGDEVLAVVAGGWVDGKASTVGCKERHAAEGSCGRVVTFLRGGCGGWVEGTAY